MVVVSLDDASLSQLTANDAARKCDKFADEIESISASRNEIALCSLSPCSRLDKLNVSHNRLETIHGLPRSLDTLNMAHNRLRNLRGVDVLSNLQQLDLSFNCLENVQGISGCTMLVNLNLSGNLLTGAAGIEGLPRLVELHLGNNLITTAGSLKSLKSNRSLRSLWLKGNPLAAGATSPASFAATVADMLGLHQLVTLDGRRVGTESVSTAAPHDSQHQRSSMDVLERSVSVDPHVQQVAPSNRHPPQQQNRNHGNADGYGRVNVTFSTIHEHHPAPIDRHVHYDDGDGDRRVESGYGRVKSEPPQLHRHQQPGSNVPVGAQPQTASHYDKVTRSSQPPSSTRHSQQSYADNDNTRADRRSSGSPTATEDALLRENKGLREQLRYIQQSTQNSDSQAWKVVDEMKRQLVDLRSEKVSLEKSLSVLEDRVEALSHHSKMNVELQGQLAVKTAELSAASTDLEASRSDVAYLRGEKENVEGRCEMLLQQLDAVNQSLVAERNEKEALASDLEVWKMKHREKIDSLDEEWHVRLRKEKMETQETVQLADKNLRDVLEQKEKEHANALRKVTSEWEAKLAETLAERDTAQAVTLDEIRRLHADEVERHKQASMRQRQQLESDQDQRVKSLVAEYTTQSVALRNEVSQLQSKLKEKEAAADNLGKSVEQMQRQVEDCTHSFEKAIVETKGQCDATLEKERADAEEERERLTKVCEDKLSEQQTRFDTIKSDLENQMKEQVETQVAHEREKLTAKHEEEKQMLVKALESQLKDREKLLTELQNLHTDQDAMASILKDEMVKSEYDKELWSGVLHKQVKAATDFKEALIDSIRQWMADKKELSQSIQQLDRELQSEVVAANEEVKSLKEELHSAKQALQSAEEDRAKLAGEVNDLRHMVDEVNERNEQLHADNASIRLSNRLLQEEADRCEARLGASRLECKRLSEDVERAEDVHRTSTEKMLEYHRENRRLKDQLNATWLVGAHTPKAT